MIPSRMPRVRTITTALVPALIAAALVAFIGHPRVVGQPAVAKGKRIAVFGSSVAYGSGDERGKES
jgi:hypothetical protein